MVALDLLGRRWTLRVLWELRDAIAPLTRWAEHWQRGVAAPPDG